MTAAELLDRALGLLDIATEMKPAAHDQEDAERRAIKSYAIALVQELFEKHKDDDDTGL